MVESAPSSSMSTSNDTVDSTIPSNENGVSNSSSSSSSPIPSKKSLKNEAKNKAKHEKFLAKQAKLAAAAASNGSKNNNNSDIGSNKSNNISASQKESSKKKELKESNSASNLTPVFVNKTPKGEKKNLSEPMSATYNPVAVEAAWYDWWEKEGFFKPELDKDGKSGKKEGTFVIPIPPPNVTGSLHLGHALTNSIQDALIRWHRMKGETVLWVPGCDHSGISTQVVVEKKLYKEKKLTRHDLGREAFVKEIWKYKDFYGNRIYSQLKRLGSSFDWDRVRFTLDDQLCKAVVEAFVTLHDEGTIYRENRLVNWCTKLNTALSNLEVENKELSGPTYLSVPDHNPDKKYEFGVLHKFAYSIEGSDEKIIVATTRIETMLGDTAVAVHSQDPRYKHLHGKFVIHPFNQRRIPIITDDILVDPEFGTGAVKITPAHDFNDFETGIRHGLQKINILNDDGTINDAGAPFTGMKRFDAREAVIKALELKGLFIETVPNPGQKLPVCERSGNIVEPLLKPQWWVNCQSMAKAAIDAVKNKELLIFPEISEKEWFYWLENIQDWCISRQLWWGHRVPAYLIVIDGKKTEDTNSSNWVSGRTYEEALAKAQMKFPNVAKDSITLDQDPDVLDTWFSSGLWPFSIMGWPEKTKDMELFYPNTLLETGWDILFFWVARMVILGIKLTGKVPFKHVFCHAMVRDAHGRKMSKSLGNVIDPLDVIEGISLDKLQSRLDEGNLDPREVEKAKAGQKADFPNGIPECGTDALRFALCAYTSAGRSINLDILRVDGYRKFCNKLWNMTKFAIMKLGDDFKPLPTNSLTGQESLAEKWILSRLAKTAKDANVAFENMNFMEATNALYQFTLYDLADVYLEICKLLTDDSDVSRQTSARNTLYTCIDETLRLLHPFMPFVTEELWQRLPRRPSSQIQTIMKAEYPRGRPEWNNPKAEMEYEIINSVIHAGRSLTVEYGLNSKATIYACASNAEMVELLRSQTSAILHLIKAASHFHILSRDDPIPSGCVVYHVSEEVNILLLVKGMIDFEQEISKLEKKQSKIQQNISSLSQKMKTEGYEMKVPEKIREENDRKLVALNAEIDTIAKAIKNFMQLKDN